MADPLDAISKLIRTLAPDKRRALARLLEPAAEPIAIVGMGCRIPGGGDTPESFWRLIAEGVDAVTQIPADRLEGFDLSAPERRGARWGAFLKDVRGFDADFFGISPREAVSLDPQQRLLLEVAWEALEDAGLVPGELAGSDTGVFVGVTNTDYQQLVTGGDLDQVDVYCTTGNGHCFPAGRLAYVLGLHGPTAAVDTACSSSLVAVHLACQSLRTRESSLALAGGVNLILSPATAQLVVATQALSPDGRCRAFDAEANGFVRGEGCGVVVLKRLSDAQADGDRIWAVIRGSAVNHDGRSVGLTAPSVQAQRLLLEAALKRAGVEPASIDYIEAHGTGTSLGDPIELEALADVVGRPRPDGSTCALGALKANVGHLEAAAGIAGLIKTALCLHHRAIPGLKHFSTLNPRIDLARTCFSTPTTLQPWAARDVPRRAGVSAFGFSGTNAHVCLEEAPQGIAAESEAEAAPPGAAHLLPLSARTPAALRDVVRSLERSLAAGGAHSLRDLAYTASFRRTHHPERAAFAFRSREELLGQLRAFDEGQPHAGVARGKASTRRPKIVFVFPGQGSQWVGMGRALLREEPVFQTALRACDEAIQRHAGFSVLERLAQPELGSIDVVQPTLFALQVALAALWRSWGIEPDAIVGHSMGELAAAHVAGSLELDDAARVICRRSRLLLRVSGRGAMAAVELPLQEAQAALAGREQALSVAVSNSPRSTVIAGDPGALEALCAELEERGVACRRVKVDVASHSPQMDPLAPELLEALRGLTPKAPAVPFHSAVTTRPSGGVELDAAYWVKNLRAPVRFAETTAQLIRAGHGLFVELSPHPVLTSSVEELLREAGREGVAIPSLRREQDERAVMLEGLGLLHAHGVPVRWQALFPQGGRVAALPRYPFQRQPFWIAPAAARPKAARPKAAAGHPLLGAPVAVAMEPGLRLWQGEVEVASAPYLGEHRVRGEAVLPGAAYVELALAAAGELFGEGTVVLSELEFERMLALPETGRHALQLCVREGAGDATFQLFARPVDAAPSGEWSRHGSGKLRVEPVRPAPHEGPGTVRERLQTPASAGRQGRLGAAEVYTLLGGAGIEYGPAFRGLQELIWSGQEALGHVRAPTGQPAEGFRFDPALLDACFQVLGALLALDATGGAGPARLLVGAGVESVRFHRPPGSELWVHARLRPAREGEDRSGDVVVLDADGRVVIEVLGARSRTLESLDAALDRPPGWRGWLYNVELLPAPLAPPATSTPGRWLLLGGTNGAAAALRRRLEARGATVELARGDVAAAKDTLAPGVYEHVVYLFDDTVPDALEATRSACASVARLAGALSRRAAERPPRLWVVTRGACRAAPGDERLLKPEQATLWGLTLAFAYEHPELRCTRVDLDPRGAGDDLAALAAELVASGPEDQVVLRADGRRVARLRELAPLKRAPAAGGAPLLRAEATYLITGGLGGLGLSLARWLIERGGRHLVLVSRSEGSEAARAEVEALRAAGARVELARVDIADQEAVRALFQRMAAELPPLRGIAHAAVALDDGLLANLDEARFRTVFAAKVHGAWNLHLASLALPLDFFVLYSSAASMMGNPGQANYSAANAFMDALAHVRHGLGLPGLSINWGPFAEKGLAAPDVRRFESLGLRPIHPAEGHAVLEDLLASGLAQVGVLPVRRGGFRRWAAQAAFTRMFDDLLREEAPARSPSAPSPLAALEAAGSDEARLHLLSDFTCAQLARVLRRPAAQLPRDERLTALGLDSMMALELRNRLRDGLGQAVSIASLLSGPTVEELAQLLLAQSAPRGTPALPQGGDAPSPLSASQRSLWFIQRLEPTATAYNVAIAAAVAPARAAEALPAAFATLQRRHPLLRARIRAAQAGEPTLEIAAEEPLPLEWHDASALTAAELDGALAHAAHRPFDLERGPVWRVALYQRPDDSVVMLLVVHHIVSDFWSLTVLFDELRALLAGGPDTALPAPAATYQDFVQWQAGLVRSAEGERQWAHWKDALRGPLPALALPTDRPRPAVQTYRGAAVRLELGVEQTRRLRALAESRETTLYVVLLAALDVLLARYAGQDEVIVGSPTAGRARREYERVFGYFVNPVAMRADLSDDPTFAALLQRTRATVLSALDNADLPFSTIVDRLQLARDASRSPLFQVMFVLQKPPPELEHLAGFILGAPGATLEAGPATLRPFPLEERAAPFDLTLFMVETEAGLQGSLQYNSDLFERSTAAAMAGAFRALLEEVARDPERPCRRLPLLTPAERRALVAERNPTPRPYPRDRGVPALFAERAAAAPEAIAVVQGAEALTYRELDARSERLARHLRALGVGVETPVGICLDRSFGLVISMLAVLRAGGAYVPFDPGHPPERRARVLGKAGARVVICEEALAASVRSQGFSPVEIDALPPGAPEVDLPGSVDPDALAYVMFTSGSTGEPKGVAVSHRAIVRLVGNTDYVQLGPEDRVAHLANVAFDAATFEVWGPLLNGGRIIVVPSDVALRPAPFAALLREQGVTAMFVTTGLFNQIAQEEPGAFRSVRTVLFGGETADPRWVGAVLAARPERLINVYGPTENTTFSTWYSIDQVDGSAIPIGRSIAHSTVYVLDANLEPVPDGLIGEVFVGGDGVARGYVGSPALTASRFVPDPFSREPGARLYRTGDLGRWVKGELVLSGRGDRQVKIRGFRIELEEVEAVLRQQRGVLDAVVLARSDPSGVKRLVAYVVVSNPTPTSTSELRATLAQVLPDYMVPSLWVAMERLPLTPNGKVDRAALPAPTAAAGTSAEAPRNPTEALLAEIWREVMRIDHVGVHDNFFELGGDSILTIQIVSRANRAGLGLLPSQLLQHQTIAALAAVAGRLPAAPERQDLAHGEVALTPVQRWFFELELEEPHHFNQAMLLSVAPGVTPESLQAALAAVITHHDALRLQFTRGPAGWTQRYADGAAPAAFERCDLSAVPRGERAGAIERLVARIQGGLRLSGPLVRAAYIHLGDGEPGRLLWVVHHLAVDMVSWRFLLEDLQTALAQLARGEAPRLPPKTGSYGTWAAALAERERATAGAGAETLDPSRAAPAPAVPVDHPDGANVVGAMEIVEVQLDVSETLALLRELPTACRARIDELLLATFAQAYAGWSGARELLVALEGHGRAELDGAVDVTRTVGWFTTLTPVRVDMSAAASLDACLRAVKQRLRARGERLVRVKPSISFNYLGQLDDIVPPGGALSPAPEPVGAAWSPRNRRPFELDVLGAVRDGRLRMELCYSRERFERATIERLGQRLAEALRALLARDRRAGPVLTPADFPLARLDQAALDALGPAARIEDVYALTPMQQGLLFQTLHTPGSGVYTEQLVYSLEGVRSAETLHHAWRATVERHPALRARMAWDGILEPVQIIERTVDVPWTEVDWTAVDPRARLERLEALLREDRARGFELARAPLLRLWWIQTGPGAGWMLVSFHHILLDGWSIPRILRDVLALHDAGPGEATLGPPPPPFRDFIAWLQRRDPAAVDAFWRERFAGYTPSPVSLWERGAGPAVESATRRHTRELSAERTTRLAALARAHHVTLSTLVQGAWALVLGQASGASEVVYGTTLAGRPADLPGAEAMVGVFIDTLPMRVALPADATVAAWLQGLQAQLAEIAQHGRGGLARIRQLAGVAPGAELFETLVVFENYPLEEDAPDARTGAAPRARITGVQPVEQTHYALTLVAVPGDALGLSLLADPARVDEETVHRLLARVEWLLEALAADPDRRLAALPRLPAAERSWLARASAGVRLEPPAASVPELVLRQAAATPDALAIATGDAQLSYRQLVEHATRLARQLRALGVGPEERVALCLDRSAELVVGMLGALLAGAAYVPLDPQAPPARLAALAGDSAAKVVLARAGRALEGLPASVTVLAVDAAGAALPSVEPVEPGPPDAQRLAYAIFTSGSTGRPKAVAVTHANLAHLVRWHHHAFALTPGDRVTVCANPAFDACTWEIWPALAAGATLHMVPREALTHPEGFAAWLGERGITTAFLPTPLAEVMLPALARAPGRLRLLLTGGDRLRRAPEAALPFQLVNNYGPTEITVVATSGPVRAGDGLPDIGGPIANASAYVLDSALQPAAIDVPGELYVGGLGVARGYLGRPDETAARFLPDPFSSTPGARMYRTGDRARWRADGTLVFLGRVDHQIKLRGHRVEPGEIEAALLAVPGVSGAAVRLWEDPTPRLVAYVSRAGDAPDAATLRTALAVRLPEVMIPAAFVFLPALPLTPNGKVDRAALPAPVPDEDARAYVAPRTPAEETLAAIWSAVLGVPRPSVRDGFFELGGDSISSLRIISRARHAGLAFTTRELFTLQTIEAVAAAARPVEQDARFELREGPTPLTPIQRWFFEQDLPDRHHFNLAVMLEARAPLDPAALEGALQHLVKQHDALRLRYEARGGRWEQRQELGEARAPLAWHDLSGLGESDQLREVEARASSVQESLDLSRGPLFAAAVFEFGLARPTRMLLAVHHLVSDVVSLRILLEDLQAAYGQLRAGRPLGPPRKATSFQQWADHLVGLARSEGVAQTLPYWRTTGATETAALPCDRAGEGSVASSRTLSVALDEEATRALLRLPREGGVQVNEAVLAALCAALAGWTGQRTFRIDVEGHGREDTPGLDVSRAVGWFTTMFPVRLELPAGAGARELVGVVAEQLRQLPHRGLSYGLLRYLGGDEALAQAPAAELSFNYLGRTDVPLPGDAAFVPVEGPTGACVAASGRRAHKLGVVAQLRGDRLHIDWSYSAELHAPETVARLSELLLDALADVALTPEPGLRAAPDSRLAPLEPGVLARLRERFPDATHLYPATPMQQGLLFHSLYDDSGQYFEQIRFGLRPLPGGAPIHAELLAAAWQRAVDRHPALRTAFVMDTHPPLQVVGARAVVPVRVMDLRDLAEREQAERVDELCARDRAEGFRLEQAPLLRLMLLRLDEARWQLVLTHHHALFDGWSLPLILRDVFDAYRALLLGAEPALAAAPSYGDFVAWLSRRAPAEAEAFWRAELAGWEAPTPLGPTLGRHSGGLSERGREPRRVENVTPLSAELTARLRAVARAHQLTPNTLLLGAWLLVVSRRGGERDVLVGITEAGRPAELPGVESMVGLFVNTLPLRMRLPPERPALDWLRELQDKQLEVRRHGHVPLVQLHEWASLPRGVSLFDSLFAFENYADGSGDWRQSAGLLLEDVRTRAQTHYPVTVLVVPGEVLSLQTICLTEQADAGDAARLAEQLVTAVTALVEDVRQPLGAVSTLSPAERRRVLVEWNATARAFPSRACLHDLFRAQVGRTPDTVALVEGERTMTYAELDARSNQLAHHLRALGVGPEVPVGICVRRSLEMFVGVLGILKAGGAYVPLDPAYPADYLAHVQRSSGITAVVTQAELAGSLDAALPTVRLDADAEALRRRPISEPDVPMTSDHLAYTVYTTGSTGVPKGALGTHRATVNRLAWMWEAYPFAPGEVLSQKTSLNFLDSVWEMFGGLLRGLRTVILPQELLTEPAALLEALDRGGVTRIVLVPSLLRALLAEPSLATRARRLRVWVTSGEALPGDLAKRFLDTLPDRLLLNLYGSTEVAADVTAQPILAVEDPAAPVPIGRPIANTQLYILDEARRPVPVGVVGELYVGGEAVCRGYHDQPGLTAERFVPDPFSGRPGSCLFRTGDRVFAREDGTLVYLGRADQQAKARGYRIELGAVETLLREQPGVRQAIAQVREDRPGDSRLVAYVVPEEGVTLLPAQLRDALAARLPSWSVPSVFMILDTLPMTPSGKIRRAELPPPAPSRPTLPDAFVAPRTPVERTIAEIWQSVLGVATVGIYDNFFDLGGHSLLGTQIIARIRRTFDLELPVRVLFEVSHVAGLADRVETLRWMRLGRGAEPTGSGTDEHEEGVV